VEDGPGWNQVPIDILLRLCVVDSILASFQVRCADHEVTWGMISDQNIRVPLLFMWYLEGKLGSADEIDLWGWSWCIQRLCEELNL